MHFLYILYMFIFLASNTNVGMKKGQRHLDLEANKRVKSQGQVFQNGVLQY